MVRGMRARTFAALVLAVPHAGPAAEPASRVTTDSREYCLELAGRLSALPGAQEEAVRRMVEEGLRMCEEGHARAGVARLRRAAVRAARRGE